MFKIKKLAKDADALLALALAFAGVLFLAFLPEAPWDRLTERGAYLAALLATPLGVVVLRYVLRMIGAAQQGKVMQAIASDPHAPDITPAIAPVLATNAPAEVGTSLERVPGGLAPEVDLHAVLLAALKRAEDAQRSGTNAEAARGAAIAVTDLASELRIVL